MLTLIIAGGVGFVFVQQQLVPETYGDLQGRYGPYRAAALDELKLQPEGSIRFIADNVCHECHESVHEERAEAKHITVSCVHCHGHATEHVQLAKAAVGNENAVIPVAHIWDDESDGNATMAAAFAKHDLLTTEHKTVCLSCHERVVGMPEDFQSIITVVGHVDNHLEEQGADEPLAFNTCFECHSGHDTAP
ncbi:MAG: hypothetical protein COA78_02915 [Blastopirellula sp.]|nr:MAG: hypothetical protein COA78_02915 [Blastopirellula sp.]